MVRSQIEDEEEVEVEAEAGLRDDAHREQRRERAVPMQQLTRQVVISKPHLKALTTAPDRGC